MNWKGTFQPSFIGRMVVLIETPRQVDPHHFGQGISGLILKEIAVMRVNLETQRFFKSIALLFILLILLILAS